MKRNRGMKASEAYELARGITVADYKTALGRKDATFVADLIERRFSERYFIPLMSIPRSRKHGFAIMAVCCLCIEAMESFRQGWENTDGKGKCAFCEFLKSEAPFRALYDHSIGFYRHVRCGILHQAETTAGWRIRRDGPLFDPRTQTLNATTFLRSMRQSLGKYADSIRGNGWDHRLCRNAVKKLDAICRNCERTKAP
jgi:hypothetical protein